MSKILLAVMFMAYCAESELILRYYQDRIGSLCSDVGCRHHGSKAQFKRAVTEQYSSTSSLGHGGWPSLRLKGGSGRNSKRQDSGVKAFQEPSEPLLVEHPPAQIDAEEAEDEGAECTNIRVEIPD